MALCLNAQEMLECNPNQFQNSSLEHIENGRFVEAEPCRELRDPECRRLGGKLLKKRQCIVKQLHEGALCLALAVLFHMLVPSSDP